MGEGGKHGTNEDIWCKANMCEGEGGKHGTNEDIWCKANMCEGEGARCGRGGQARHKRGHGARQICARVKVHDVGEGGKHGTKEDMMEVNGASEWCKWMVQVNGGSAWWKWTVQVHGAMHGASERCKCIVQVDGASSWCKCMVQGKYVRG